MRDNYHNYQLLLAKAAQLYERHRVGRPEPFNVFSVLHKENGTKVNLHSRFFTHCSTTRSRAMKPEKI